MALVTVNQAVLAPRQKFFYRPTGAKEIHDGKRIVEADLSSLLGHLEACNDDPHLGVLLIEDPIPEEFYEAHRHLKQEVKEDPGLARDVSNYIPTPARLFLKSPHHALVLNTRRSLQLAVANGLSARDLRRMKFIQCNDKGEPMDDEGETKRIDELGKERDLKPEEWVRILSDEGQLYNGLAYAGMRSRQRRVVTLVEAIEGLKLFAYSDLSHHRPDKIKFKRYTPERRGQIKGATYRVEVPSRSPNKDKRPENYRFWMHHVPLPQASSRYVVWTEEHARGDQPEKAEYHIDNEFVVDPYVWSAHAHAAHMAIAQSFKPHHFLDMPVPLVTQFLVERVYNMLRKHVRVVVKDEQGKPHREYLNEAQLEIILWKAVLRYGYEKTIDVDSRTQGRIQDYAWCLHPDGSPFQRR